MTGTVAKFLKSTGSLAIVLAWTSLSSHCAEGANPTYHLVPGAILSQFDEQQIGVVEKLNRADRAHMIRAAHLVVPDSWVGDELQYSPLPAAVPRFEPHPKMLLVFLPDQVFGAYEDGRLVRWGPVSSGRAAMPTPQGLFYLNWRSRERASTDNPRWRMRWYFNFDNRRGLAFHEYGLPGLPASHACIRLLARDAQWLFAWGEGWMLSPDRREVLRRGTPVLILGAYAFEGRRPWLDPESRRTPIALSQSPELLVAANGG
jgi:hypothetical protein